MIRSMNLKFKYGECNSTNENAHEKQGHVWGSICNCWNTLIIMNVRSQKGKLGNAFEIQGRIPGESEAGRELLDLALVLMNVESENLQGI